MSVPGISIVLVAPVRIYRQGLTSLLTARSNTNVYAAGGAFHEVLGVVAAQRPDLVIVDVSIPGAISIIEHVHQLLPSTRVIALGVSEEERAVLACAGAGVRGYVGIDGTMDDLLAAIDHVLRGDVYCPPPFASPLVRGLLSGSRVEGLQSGGSPADLTTREREILALLEAGCSNKEIAQRLSIEVATVKNHVHNLLQKLHVTSRAEAAARFRLASR